MAGVYAFLKRQCLKRCPEPLLERLRAFHYERALRAFREDDEPDLRVVRHLVPRGATAVDLGANIGVYTRFLSHAVGSDGRVISVEPVPQTFRILARNIQTFGLANVTPVNAAVSDAPGRAVMELPPWETGGENLYQAHVVESHTAGASPQSRRVEVDTVTLDALVGGAGRVSFVKCDVEGHELACLRGAGEVLRAHRPAWLIEVWGNPDVPGEPAAAVFDLLHDEAYASWIFDGTHLVERRPGERATNYFFLTPDRADALRASAPYLFG
jgi:FkbM family methyltransferase